MKVMTTLFFFLVFTTSSFSQSQGDMNQTARDDYQQADDELNLVYKQILSDYKNDSIFIVKLKISQRLWVKFRDAELEMKFPQEDKWYYGSMYSMCAAGYLAELTKERTEKLKEWLTPLPDGEGCGGSIKRRE